MQQSQQKEETVSMPTLAGQPAAQPGAPGTPDSQSLTGYEAPPTPPSDADLGDFDRVLYRLSQRSRVVREMVVGYDEEMLEILVDMRRKVETRVQAGYVWRSGISNCHLHRASRAPLMRLLVERKIGACGACLIAAVMPATLLFVISLIPLWRDSFKNAMHGL